MMLLIVLVTLSVLVFASGVVFRVKRCADCGTRLVEEREHCEHCRRNER